MPQDVKIFNMEINTVILRLFLTKGIGPITFKKILNKFGKNFFYKENFKEKLLLLTLSKYIKDFITNWKDAGPRMEKCLMECEKNKISIVTIIDKIYPPLLKELPDSPIVLFYYGKLDEKLLEKKFCSVVGTRNNTLYGEKVAREIANILSGEQIVIVSGLAIGIDSLVHLQALKNNAITIAVLGIPLEEKLTKKTIINQIIKKKGVIFSEYPPGEKIDPGMFIRRNRIIAGLSSLTIIIEAGKKSGALSTAQFALDYNRDVLAVPGEFGKETSFGTNWLIKNSTAELLLTKNDILQSLGLASQERKISLEEERLENSLTEKELVIYKFLREFTELNLEEMSVKSGYDIIALSNICSTLELKGAIIKNIVGYYSLV